jgi:hypothetical protein
MAATEGDDGNYGSTGGTGVRGNSASTPEVLLICHPRRMKTMKQIHVWPNHIRVPHLDLVLVRNSPEPLAHTLSSLARMGFDTRPENVEVHGELPAQ